MKPFTKKDKKDNKQIEAKTEDVIVSATTIEEPIVENVIIPKVMATENLVAKNRKKKKEPKAICRVMLATPSYYIIRKNGENITIQEQNNYCEGQEILH